MSKRSSQSIICQHKNCGAKSNLLTCRRCKNIICLDCVTDHAIECCYEPGVMYKTW